MMCGVRCAVLTQDALRPGLEFVQQQLGINRGHSERYLPQGTFRYLDPYLGYLHCGGRGRDPWCGGRDRSAIKEVKRRIDKNTQAARALDAPAT
eukprot:2844436-Rhodomonas_salina.2